MESGAPPTACFLFLNRGGATGSSCCVNDRYAPLLKPATLHQIGFLQRNSLGKMSASQREDRTRLDGFEVEIFKLVREGSTSKQWREWLRVPLEHAAADGNMDLFARLMDAGADGSAGWRGCHGRTLLGAAARGKSEEMVVTLLRAGAKDDVHVQFGKQRESALHVGAKHGAEAASRALMFAGADTNLPNWEKNTPLHLSAEHGHDGVVSDLMVRGADLHAKNDRQQTPLHLAAMSGRVLCVYKLLLGGAEKDQRDNCGATPLHLAAEDNKVGVVEELLAAKADPDILAYDRLRPLDTAARRGFLDVLRALLRHGSDVKACNWFGYTALHHAAENNDDPDDPSLDNSGAVRVLLEAGADTEAKTTGDVGQTPLHLAMGGRASSRGTVCALLEGGANVNAGDAHGRVPLHIAIIYSNAGGIELLLRWGADEMLVDKYGHTAADEVGKWEEYHYYDDDDEEIDQERKADDQRIRRMLARAPADRLWRRRGWLVLARSCPSKVQLAQDSHGGGRSGKVVKASCDGFGEGDGGTGDQGMVKLASLVRRVVDLDAKVVFRLIVGFL